MSEKPNRANFLTILLLALALAGQSLCGQSLYDIPQGVETGGGNPLDLV